MGTVREYGTVRRTLLYITVRYRESLNICNVLSFIFMLMLSLVVVFKVSVFVLGILLLHFKGLLGLLLHFMHYCFSMVRYGTVRYGKYTVLRKKSTVWYGTVR